MSDKEKFKDTFIDNEDLWERCALFFMYVPFIVNSIKKMISYLIILEFYFVIKYFYINRY